MIRQFDERAIRDILTAAKTDDSGRNYDDKSTQYVYNADDLKGGDGKVILPAGTLLTDTYGPASFSVAAGAGGMYREHTHTDFDDGAPNSKVNPATGQRYGLATKVTVGASTGVGVADADTVSVTTNSYDKLDASDATEGSGWVLGSPVKVTSGGVTTVTRRDVKGRVTQSRQPMSNGSDAGTTNTVYYDAGAAGVCGQHPEWAGLVCHTQRAAAASAGAGGALTLPASDVTYSRWLVPAVVTESSGSSSRTTTTTYDAAARPVSVRVVASIPGSVALPGSFTRYNASSGLVDYTGNLNAAGTDATSVRTSYTRDGWGRETSRTTDQGESVSTSYDAAGRLEKVTDSKGSTSYVYDNGGGADSGEHRGLVTGEKVSRAGSGGDLSFAASYDASGRVVSQSMPGGVTKSTSYDAAGRVSGLAYAGKVGSGTATWFAQSPVRDVVGRLMRVDGGRPVADPSGGVSGAGAGSVSYAYDGAGRLTNVWDRVSAANGALTCRLYYWNADGNRDGMSTVTGAGDNSCQSGTTVNRSYAYDSADRATVGAGWVGQYSYDGFGRARVIPAVDTAGSGAGDVGVGYFDTDQVASISQGGMVTSFGVDSAGRRMTQSSTSGGVTSTVVRHYSDDSDNPSWVQTTGGASAGVTRFAESIGGDLGLSVTDTGAATVDLVDLHGDVVAGVAVAAGQASATPSYGITGWSTYTEFGVAADPSSAKVTSGVLGYGWLGGRQRSTTDATAGFTLMGARLYNPQRGLFTSVDPVAGGNDNAYTYPNDPVNECDASGQWGVPGWAGRAGHEAWGATKWGLGNKYVRGAAVSVGVGALCAASAGIGCAVAAGAVIGGGLSVANYRVNGRGQTRSGYIHAAAVGAAHGAASGAFGFIAGRASVAYGARNQATWSAGRHVLLRKQSYVSTVKVSARVVRWRQGGRY